MSEDGVRPTKKEPKIGVMLPGGPNPEKPSSGQLIIKPTKEHYSATTPDEREEQQTEEERIRKAFNSVPKLKKILFEIFKQEEWDCKDSGTLFVFTNKQNSKEVIRVEKAKDEIRFSGTPIKKLVEAVNHYERRVDVELEFEVGANTVDDAKAFMKSLHENGFDIRKIARLNLRSKGDYDLQEMIAEITNTPVLKAKRAARPGGRKHTSD